MVSIPIEWRLGIKGSDEVKSELNQLADAFNRAKDSGADYSKEQRVLSNAVGRRLREDQLQNRLYMVQHPLLLKSMRAISTISSLTRTLLTVQNALNLAKLTATTVDIQGMTIQKDLNEALRYRAELIKQGKTDTEEWYKNEEKINILLAEQKDHIQNLKDSKFNEWITGIESALVTVSAIALTFGRNLASLKSGITLLTGFATSIGGSLMLIGIASAFIGGQIADWLVKLFDLEDWRANNGKMLEKFFIQDIPMAIGSAGVALTQFFLTDLPLWAGTGLDFIKKLFINTWNSIISTTNFGVNSVISGINSIVNGAISAINSFISAINSILKKAKLGTIPLIPKFQGIPPINIPMIAAAKGFNGMVTQPTMFLAGEAGPEQVSISPNGRTGSGNTIIINVAGSVVTEKRISQMVDQYQKQNLKSRGFTGFG